MSTLEEKLRHAVEMSLRTSPQGEGEEKAKGMVMGAASGMLGVGGAAVSKVKEGASKLVGAMAGLWHGGKQQQQQQQGEGAKGEAKEAWKGEVKGGEVEVKTEGPEGGEAAEAARGEPEPKAKLNAALASALLGEIPVGEKQGQQVSQEPGTPQREAPQQQQ